LTESISNSNVDSIQPFYPPPSPSFEIDENNLPVNDINALKEILSYLQTKEKKLKNNLGRTQSSIRKLQKLIQKNNESSLPYSLENIDSKKLSNEDYERVYDYMMNNSEAKKRLVLKTHKMVSNILELAGELYFLKVPKSFKKPPSVGFRFRSYTDSHYTSEDRDNPIACKVREFPSER